ncbi:unnamed protein product [Danaus chrysippus]|uniref:(African queen) hypothetical protein n=1 Tax=Danaus chrysippus TaxID=151541 RepID=A0A8J2VT16_9NEOP|nr:unnamed protein product [Danaus chrysippus]
MVFVGEEGGPGSVQAGAGGGGGEACKAGGYTGGGSSSAGAGRFLPGSEVVPAAGCWAAAAVYVKPSVAGRDRNNNDVIDAQNTPKAQHKNKLCEHKRRRGERDQAEEEKRARASEARACSLVAYRAARLRLKVRLQVQGRVEIAAGVADAAALDGVHAHRDTAVVVSDHRRRRVREATLGLGPLARAAQELPAHLHHHTPAMSRPAARPLAPPRYTLQPLLSNYTGPPILSLLPLGF